MPRSIASRVIVIVVLMVAVVGPVPTHAQALLQEMTTLERSRNDAIRKKDIAAIERMYADDFSGVASNGRVVTRAELLDVFRRQEDGFVGTSDDVAIRPLGANSVVVTGRLTITRPSDPKFTALVSRFMHIFQQRDGRWQMVTGQSTPIPPPAAP